MSIEDLASLHRCLPEPSGQPFCIALGSLEWRPAIEETSLAEDLHRALAHSGIVDLILYGSQARGKLTGFSDVDAVLVLEDAVAEDTRALRALRPRVLAAQRAVLAYQPMQHHAFEVATVKLLGDASEALGLPVQALSDTRSLNGSGLEASSRGETRSAAKNRLRELALGLQARSEWPRHAGFRSSICKRAEFPCRRLSRSRRPDPYLGARGGRMTFFETSVCFGPENDTSGSRSRASSSAIRGQPSRCGIGSR
jgi:Nucleotidyltransferase domain